MQEFDASDFGHFMSMMTGDVSLKYDINSNSKCYLKYQRYSFHSLTNLLIVETVVKKNMEKEKKRILFLICLT